jgi:serralysin
MSRLTRVPTALVGAPNSQNANINSLIYPVVWAGTTLTYSFPTDPSQYVGYAAGEEPSQAFQAAGAPYKASVKFAFDTVSEFTNLTFQEIAPTTANPATLRFGISGDPQPTPGRPAQPDFAGWGYLPADSATAGDIWIKGNQNINAPFQPGSFRWSLVIHEIGHGLGLGHPFDTGNLGGNVLMDPTRDSTEYTIMAYRASTTVPGRQTVGNPETGGEPQTWMQYDVAALQQVYGANFNTRAGNTVYTWNPLTGQMSVDGVAYGFAPEVNRILMNIWDGNGIDTYDFSNYTTNVISDLRPGEWSSPSADQVAITNTQLTPNPAKAPGSISNSLLFNGDERSLIENANGGSGNDNLTGNQAANTLRGNQGNDTLSGNTGNDNLDGGSGADSVDGGDGFDTVTFTASATRVIVNLFAGDGFEGDAAGDRYLGIEAVVASNLDDIVVGTAVGNFVDGQAGNDTLYSNLGNDTLLGGTGNDVMFGEGDNDLMFGWVGADVLIGGEGADTLSGEQDNDTLLGDVGDDVMFGVDGNDVLYGWVGADVLWGGEGQDTLWGEQDNDTLLGEVGNDILLGIDGNDVMFGWLGNDSLFGWLGDDVLWGEQGSDLMLGEDGNDVFVGGLDRDTMTGGQGADRFFNANFEIAAGDVDLITDFDTADTYLFQTGAQIQYFAFNAAGYGAGAGIHVQVAGGVYILDVFGATTAQLQAQTVFF